MSFLLGGTLRGLIAGGLMIAAPLTAAGTFRCTVTGVHDGDGPIYCAEGMKVRLQAIAARELDGTCRRGHPCPAASAEAAAAELWRLTRGQRLTCEQTGTSYRRVTAWCRQRDRRDLSCAMLRSGTVAYWRRFDRDGRLNGCVR